MLTRCCSKTRGRGRFNDRGRGRGGRGRGRGDRGRGHGDRGRERGDRGRGREHWSNREQQQVSSETDPVQVDGVLTDQNSDRKTESQQGKKRKIYTQENCEAVAKTDERDGISADMVDKKCQSANHDTKCQCLDVCALKQSDSPVGNRMFL